jgi:hypothetical protein
VLSVSHIVHARTGIFQPDQVLLAQSCAIVAGQHEGGRVTDSYLSWGWQHQTPSTGLAVITAAMPRGIGLQLAEESGELTFVGDPAGVWNTYQSIQDEIKQTYVSLGVAQAMRELGWVPVVEEGEQGELAVVARDVEVVYG